MSKLVEKAQDCGHVRITDKSMGIHGKKPGGQCSKAEGRWSIRVAPNGWYEGQRAAFRNAIAQKNNWYELIMKV